MKQIRQSIFETNSSSVHSITMCKESEYDRWRNGELYYDGWVENLLSVEDGNARVENNRKKYCPGDVGEPITSEELMDNSLYTYEDFWDYNEERFECFVEHFGGVVAFGYYGYDC